jgi:uracil phosphoribosyltransferase
MLAFQNVTVIDHPLIQDRLSTMRDQATAPADFRRLCREVGLLLAYEALRDLPLTTRLIQTPLAPMQAPALARLPPVLAPVLRAGLGFCEGILDLVPTASVAHVGLYRDHETLKPVKYYLKTPDNLADRLTLVLDPMLATGNSAAAAVELLRAEGAGAVRLLCLLAAPEGLERFAAAHPDVPVFTAAIDDRLNELGYIVPGLGDAGDRIFGTG